MASNVKKISGYKPQKQGLRFFVACDQIIHNLTAGEDLNEAEKAILWAKKQKKV